LSISRRSFSGLVSLGMAGLAPALLRAAGQPSPTRRVTGEEASLTPRTPIIIGGGSVKISADRVLENPTPLPNGNGYSYELDLTPACTYRCHLTRLSGSQLEFIEDDEHDAAVTRTLELFAGRNQSGLRRILLELTPRDGSGGSFTPRTLTTAQRLTPQGESNGKWDYLLPLQFNSYLLKIGSKEEKGNGNRIILQVHEDRPCD
jgi:hypothetical protein